MSALEGVELIHQAGGLAVMAHPGLNRTDEIIPALVDAGLDGIECFIPSTRPGLPSAIWRLPTNFTCS